MKLFFIYHLNSPASNGRVLPSHSRLDFSKGLLKYIIRYFAQESRDKWVKKI